MTHEELLSMIQETLDRVREAKAEIVKNYGDQPKFENHEDFCGFFAVNNALELAITTIEREYEETVNA